jgi:hypothetical protein
VSAFVVVFRFCEQFYFSLSFYCQFIYIIRLLFELVNLCFELLYYHFPLFSAEIDRLIVVVQLIVFIYQHKILSLLFMNELFE